MKLLDRIVIVAATVMALVCLQGIGAVQAFVESFGWGGVFALAVGALAAHLLYVARVGRCPAWVAFTAITAGLAWRRATRPRRQQAVRVR